MKSTILAAFLAVALVAPATAQQPAQPTMQQKATDAAASVLGKITTGSTTPAAAAAKAPLININKAGAQELDSLPSIGAARTKAIIAGRPYKSVDELLSRKIIPADAFAAIKDKVAVK